jgi:hypothetical protein
MTCEQIRAQLIETARGRDLPSDLRGLVFAHSANCEDCARHLEVQRQLTTALADLAISTDGAPARIEQMLRRELPVEMPRRATPAPRLPRMPLVLTGALAAAAALIVSVMLLESSPRYSSPVTHAIEAQKASVPANSTVKSPAIAPASPDAAAEEDDSLYADFTPLPYAAELSPSESTDIVRVQLPRESLMTMGIPVSADAMGQIIQADVLLGMDGTARAIRLVNN